MAKDRLSQGSSNTISPLSRGGPAGSSASKNSTWKPLPETP